MKALRKFISLTLGLLRELADESAYRRHLEAHGANDSREEWRRFSEERLRSRFTRPKCC